MTKRFLAMWFVVLSVALSVVAFAPCALAQDEATKLQAREQFNQGLSQYEASQYEAALESFQEAYRLSPHPLVRVNMANCYDRLGKPVEALFHFERFLSETEGDRSRAAQRTEVESALRRLKRSVGELNLRVIPDGSMVRVDETQERRSPIVEPIVLAAGDHVIVVTRDGFATTERRVQIRGGQVENVNITLDRESVSAVEPSPTPVIAPLTETEEASLEEPDTRSSEEVSGAPLQSQPEEDASLTTLSSEERNNTVWTPPVIIASVVSGTFLIGAGLMGLAALKADADFEGFSAQSRNPALSMREQESARRAAVSAADRADGRALTADLLFAGALISGAAAVFFALTQDDASEADDLSLRLSPTGAALNGRF